MALRNDVIDVAVREVACTDAALVLTPHPLTVQGQRVLNGQTAALVPGETLASFLARHGVQAGQQWAVCIGGVEVPELLWGRVRPKHGHLIECRRVAHKDVLRMVAMVALVWFTGGLATGGVLGFAGGSFGAAMVAGAVAMAGSMVINKLLGPKPLSAQSAAANSVSPTYSLTGGRNRARMWEPMALVLGEPYCVPDLAAQPYNYFENGEQFLWQLFHAGLNCASVSAIRIGQTAITDYQEVAVYKAGFLSGDTGFPALAASVDTVAGALLDAPTAPGAYTTRTSSTNAMHLAVDIECSLYIVDSAGKYQTWWVSIDLEYRAVGSGTWLPFVDGAATQVLSNASTRPLRLTLKRDVAPGQYEVRARKNTANETATDRQNTVQWSSLKSYQDASANYDYQAGVGVQIQASGQLTGALDEVNWQAVAKPMPYWNGAAWVTATSRASGLCNPGAIILMLARGVRDTGGRVLFGLGLEDSQIDIEGLKDFMVWCASIGAEFDYFLQETVSIDELIDSVAAVGLGAKSWHTGKLGVIWFSDAQPVESVLNMATVKAKSFSVTYDTAQTADEIEVQYFDRVRGNTWQSVRVLAPGVTAPTLTARVQLPGVSTEAAAALLARFSMAQNAFQRKTVSVEVDLEHLTFRRGTLVALSHDVTQWGYGGRVQGAVNVGGTVTLTLDDVVPAGSGSRYVGLRIPGERGYRIFPVAAFSGSSRTLTLASAWPGGVAVPGDSAGNPAWDTVWIYDFKATPGYKLRVADVSPQGNLDGARVSLVPDSPEMWTYIWTGAYTAPPDNSLLVQGVPVLTGVTFSEQRTLVGDVYLVDVTASYSVTGAFERVELFGSTGGAPLQPIATGSGLQVSWRTEAGQVWALELRPYSALHAGAVVAATYTVGSDWVPANYDMFTVTILGDGTRSFAFAYTTTPAPADLAGAVIRFKKGAAGTETWAAMSPLHDGVLTNSPIESRAGDPDVYRFALKARSRSGVESADATVRYVDVTLPAISAADQIVALLTTPVFDVPSSSAGVVSTFTTMTGELRIYYNGVLTTAGLTWTVQSDPAGLGVTIGSATGVYSLAFPGSPSGWWTAATPSATVRLCAALSADPAAYREIDLVVSKSMAGSPANDLQLNASVLTFSFDTSGTAYPAAQSSVLSVTRVPGSLAGTVSWSATAYTSSGVQVGSTGGVSLSGSGDSRTLTTGNFMAPGGSFNNTIQYVTVTATLGALSKSIRVTRTTDGQEAIISFLTNPAVSLPASSAGVVSSWAAATGDFQVWQGGVEVTSGITYAIQSNPSTLTASINSSTGVYSVTAAGSWANGSNTTSITFRATHTASGATRDAVFTLTKSLAGTDGGAGTPGADAVVYEIEPTPSTVSRNNIGVATPSSVTFYAYSKTGSAARAAFSGRFILRTTTDGTTWTGVYTSPSNESSTAFTITSGITAVRAELYANTSFTPLLQQVTVPVVRDGMRAPMSLNSNSSSTAVYGVVVSGAVRWATSGAEKVTDDAKGAEVVWRKLGYTSAPSATPGDYLIRGDLVTLFGELAHTSTPITRWWDGSAWVDPGTVIDGNLLVRGTVTLDAIKSGSTIGTSNVSFGLGVSWGPGSKVSGGYFHSTALDQFALVSDNVAGGYSMVSATTATGDAGAAFVGGGGWSGYTTTGGVTSGGYYTTQTYLNTGTTAGVFRKLESSGTVTTSEAVLGTATAAGAFTLGSYVGTLGVSGYAAEFKYGTTTNAKFGNTTTAGTFSQGSYYATMSSASYAGYFDYNNTFRAKLGTSSYAGRFGAGTSGADTRAVSLADGSYAVNIEAGTLRYQSVTINAPPNDTDYLNGDGTWKHMYLDGSSGVTSNFTGSRPSGTTANNIWISFYVGSTRLWIPAWYADS